MVQYVPCAGRCTIVRLERGPGVVTPIEEPADNQAGCWPNQRLVAVLAHQGGGALGGGGHWVPYRKVRV